MYELLSCPCGAHLGDPCTCDDDEQVNPRWRDWHMLPDQRLWNRLHHWLRRHPRLMQTRASKAIHRYALRHFFCTRDGQCVFRNGHRGACAWGDDDG